MRGHLRYLCLLLLMFTQACNVVEEMPAETASKTPEASQPPPTPRPSLTATLSPSPLPFTPTSHPPTITQTAIPTEVPLIYTPGGNLIQPSNGADEWLLYDSPRSVTVLLFDGESMWAGSQNGGLVQWDAEALTSIRHTRASGFPLRTVNDLAFDAGGGYLYAVGDEGLAIWDGTRWEGFTSGELGFLPDDPLTAVAVEGGTTIWVGAKEVWDTSVDWEVATYIGGGLAHGDWQEGTWEQYRAPDPLMSNQINDLIVDAGGKLWVASGFYGAAPTAGGVSWRDSEGNWKHWGITQGLDRADLDSLDGYAYRSLAISPDGRVYAGGRWNMSKLDPGTGVWDPIEVKYPNEVKYVQQLSLDTGGNLWITAEQGVYRLDSNYALQNVYEDPESGSWKAIALDEEGNVWFGGAAGLFRMQGESVRRLYVPDALPGIPVFDVAINGNDTVWMRSEGGISQLVGDRIFAFASESLAIEAAYPWTGRDSLWPVAPDGTLWLLDDGSLRGYNTDGWQSVPLDIPSDTYVSGYTVCGNDTLVVAVYNGLHIHLTNQGWLFAPFPQGGFVIRDLICHGLTNTIWGNFDMAENFYTGMVGQFKLEAGEWIVFNEDNGSIPYVPPYGASLSPTGEIWAVNYDTDWNFSSSVWVYQDNGTWQLNIPSPNFLGESGFREIYFGNSEDLWLITWEKCGYEEVRLTGLIYYDWADWHWFTAENSGLSSDRIYDLSVDSHGNAWLATESGLQRVPLP